ncbi:hypothetical protein CEP54_001470 [Fusarium duplospermum]|uniref:Uncharacterized protein n=1 Tax=Fusarium duplospermum TaxID=1325734 RepID=A0A428R0C5_9HYPO|nr:hypothetical protein CEP54_001470 [Fusarium duplospermum]
MPKATSRRRTSSRRSSRQPLARRRASRSRQQSESPEQQELREDRERLRPLEEAADPLMGQDLQVGSFTDSLMSPTSPLNGLGMDIFPEDHLTFPDDLPFANLNNGGPVGGSPMPPTTSLQITESQTLTTTADSVTFPSWASPQPALLGLDLPLGTAGQVAFQYFGRGIRVDTALCKKLAGEAAMRQPVQRRPETRLNMGRRSNVEALLGYVTGVPVSRPCKNCAKGHGPWHECVILEGQLCGSCTNCWFNASGSRCTFHETNQANSTYAPNPLWNTASNTMAAVPNLMQASSTLAQPTLSFPQVSPSQLSSSFPQASPLPPSTQLSTSFPQASSLPQALSFSQANSSFTNAVQPAHQPSTPQPSPPAYNLPPRLDPSN